MDDIKRPKLTRPRVAAPLHRRNDFSTPATVHASSQTPDSLGRKKSQRRSNVRILLRFRVPKGLRGIIDKLCSTRLFSYLRRYAPSRRKRPVVARFGWAGLAALMLFTVFTGVFDLRQAELQYQLSPEAEALIGPASLIHAESLTLDAKAGVYEYNKGYQPGGDVAGQSARPKFTASFNRLPEKGATVTDPVNETSVTFKPDFELKEPIQDQNRLLYPLKKGNGVKVYSLKSSGFKEDIILNTFQGDTLTFKYDLELAPGTEARMESDGSLAVYGVASTLLGNVSTGSSKDEALLKKARDNGEKSNLLFRFPAPFVVESGKKKSGTQAWFSLKKNELTVHAANLRGAAYPLSIDPSVYVETAAKLMRGNNETNVDFDVDGELIQKGSTTGARFDEWTSTMALNGGRWNQGTAVTGGYIYSVGGTRSNTSTVVYATPGTDTFTVPAGITSITVKMWGAGGGGGGGGTSSDGGNGGGGGFVQSTLTVTPGEVLNIHIGGGGGNGDFSTGTGGSSSGDGGGGGGHTEVDRSGTPLVIAAGGGGGGGGDNSSATSGGAGGAGGGTTGVVGGASSSAGGGGAGTAAAGGGGGTGGANPGSAGTSESGGAGADGRSAAGIDGSMNNGGTVSGGGGGTGDANSAGWGAGGGGGSGRFGGGGGSGSVSGNAGGGGGGGGSSYTTGSSTTNTAGSGTTPGNSSDTSRAGAGEGGTGGNNSASGADGTDGRAVVSYNTGGGSGNEVRPEVYWARFNASNKTIESPNPGTGTCTDWCTDAAYNLPDERSGLSLVAYNGFLYAVGGFDSTGTRSNHVYIAKVGANGEPSLWHPTSTNKNDWVYWYRDTGTNLSSERSYTAAAAYNNRLYVLGGQTNASSGGVTTVEYANINPTGAFGSWSTTGMSVLPSARHSHTVQIYNDHLYLIGGNSSGTLQSSIHYAKLNNDGTMNSWVATSSFTTARMTWGGSYSTVWGGYLYLSGGCSAINGSGYCTTIANDVQLVSINADGSLASWGSILDITNQRAGYGLVAWRNVLYRVGGCTAQDTGTGDCTNVLSTADYGLISRDGDASTVATSEPNGTAPCSGGSPYNCDLPGTSSIGNILSATAIMNGYLYIIGGCTNTGCTTASGNTAYVAINSDGSLARPAVCTGGTFVDSYCVDSTNPVTGGILAAGTAIFNGRIYLVGGQSSGALKDNIYHAAVNNDGSLNGTWTTQSFASIGATSVSYTFAYARANPASAGTNPGNMYIFGGCSGDASGAGCPSGSNTQAVYKCNITTTGSVSGCTTSGQLQIGTVTGASGAGLAIHAGTVYANYIYLIGGVAPGITDLTTVRYARFDNNNNVVAVSGSAWTESANQMSIGRRRGASFGYNGYLYVVGGYDGTGGGGVLSDIQFAKINVSDGSIDAFQTSGVTINQRWGLSVPVSNSYAFVIGGCINGNSPSCSTATDVIQTFQVYNNDSGAVASFTSAGDDTFAANTNRWGASSAVLNGYIYVAGGCTSATDCTTAVGDTQSAPINASDGSIGTWSTASSGFPSSAVRTWGKLVTAGGYLYYLGGQDSTATNEQSTVYYAQPSAGVISSWSAATGGIGDTNAQAAQPRTKFGAAVWNNRIYVVGGLNSSAAATTTVYVSPQLNSGGNIAADSWTSSTAFAVARSGLAVTAYANNLYIFGGYDGSNYLSDSQFTQINADGSVDSWVYSTSLPGPVGQGDAFAANGYMYLIGGRSAGSTCVPNTLIAPISANTTIATGNNPTGIGEWYETSARYAGDRYGAAVSYSQGKLYLTGGGCTAPVDGVGESRHYYGALKAQPQVAKYSRMIDTDTDVFPTKWLLNGVDNSIGARWAMRYRSMNDTDGVATDCGTADMTSWGQETNFGDVTLGTPETYIPLDGSGNNINCARFFYLSVTIDSSQSFGYPEDISRGPTIADLSLFFTSDPSKRLRHGKTFTGGEQQPLDTPF